MIADQIAHPEPGGIFQAVLCSVHSVLGLQDLGSGSNAPGEKHLHGIRPRAGILGPNHDRAFRTFGTDGVLGGGAHDVAGAAPVGKELLHRVGQVAVLPVFQLREIPAEPALIVHKTGQQHRPARNRPPFRQTDKPGGACSDALHCLDTGIKFLHIDARR